MASRTRDARVTAAVGWRSLLVGFSRRQRMRFQRRMLPGFQPVHRPAQGGRVDRLSEQFQLGGDLEQHFVHQFLPALMMRFLGPAGQALGDVRLGEGSVAFTPKLLEDFITAVPPVVQFENAISDSRHKINCKLLNLRRQLLLTCA
jgi:hypothetical protein